MLPGRCILKFQPINQRLSVPFLLFDILCYLKPSKTLLLAPTNGSYGSCFETNPSTGAFLNRSQHIAHNGQPFWSWARTWPHKHVHRDLGKGISMEEIRYITSYITSWWLTDVLADVNIPCFFFELFWFMDVFFLISRNATGIVWIYGIANFHRMPKDIVGHEQMK